MLKLSDILVVSDIDNTLLTAKYGVPECNKSVIKLFCELGGKFTVASGRSVESVRSYSKSIGFSTPAILLGGAVIYDFESDKPLYENKIDKIAAKSVLFDIMKEFPHIGVEIMAVNGKIYIPTANEQTLTHVNSENIEYILCDVEDILEDWYKVLFAGTPGEIDEIKKFVSDKKYDGVSFISTEKVYFEIMPMDTTKGTALIELCKMLDVKQENVYAIGDYYNDVELVKTAGHAVAVGNAVVEVKMESERVVMACEDGGVGEFIYSLIKEYQEV